MLKTQSNPKLSCFCPVLLFAGQQSMSAMKPRMSPTASTEQLPSDHQLAIMCSERHARVRLYFSDIKTDRFHLQPTNRGTGTYRKCVCHSTDHDLLTWVDSVIMFTHCPWNCYLRYNRSWRHHSGLQYLSDRSIRSSLTLIFQVMSLPSQTCAYKAQLTDTSVVAIAEIITMRDSVCLVCYVANGHILVHSLPSLRPLLDVDFLPLTDIRSVC